MRGFLQALPFCLKPSPSRTLPRTRGTRCGLEPQFKPDHQADYLHHTNHCRPPGRDSATYVFSNFSYLSTITAEGVGINVTKS
jgi:hypothetical protein